VLDMLTYVLTGAIAELVDSSLGMAYGVTSTTLLLSLGLSPAVASSTTHYAEIFLTATSGTSHIRMGNFDRKLFLNLVVFGTLAAVAGAYLLSSVNIPHLRTLVTMYLMCMGGVIILRAFGKNIVFRRLNTKALAALGGFLDAVGGGGWGPVVTSTLIANGYDPKKTIGSVNSAEFFVTISQSIVFLVMVGVKYPLAVLGILAGGVPAAVVGAYVTKKVKTEHLMLAVGTALIVTNLIRFVR